MDDIQVVYVISSIAQHKANHYKIGRHTGTQKKLLKRYQTAIPDVIIHEWIICDDCVTLEKAIHDKLSEFRYKPDGSTSEWFNVSLHTIRSIITIVLSVETPTPTKSPVLYQNGLPCVRSLPKYDGTPKSFAKILDWVEKDKKLRPTNTSAILFDDLDAALHLHDHIMTNDMYERTRRTLGVALEMGKKSRLLAIFVHNGSLHEVCLIQSGFPTWNAIMKQHITHAPTRHLAVQVGDRGFYYIFKYTDKMRRMHGIIANSAIVGIDVITELTPSDAQHVNLELYGVDCIGEPNKIALPPSIDVGSGFACRYLNLEDVMEDISGSVADNLDEPPEWIIDLFKTGCVSVVGGSVYPQNPESSGLRQSLLMDSTLKHAFDEALDRFELPLAAMPINTAENIEYEWVQSIIEYYGLTNMSALVLITTTRGDRVTEIIDVLSCHTLESMVPTMANVSGEKYLNMGMLGQYVLPDELRYTITVGSTTIFALNEHQQFCRDLQRFNIAEPKYFNMIKRLLTAEARKCV